ncbi:MAG TPA: universal stress protein [Paraburkholderia sp.]|nr:universal stress protein [Paraburkholderia sp.]
MLKLLIPIFDERGALEAARHGAFLFAEHCVSEIEVVEVLDDVEYDRTTAFWTIAMRGQQEGDAMRNALGRTRAILDDARVPYTWTQAFGTPARTIATYANRCRADIVVLDASRLGLVRKWSVLFGLRRFTRTPVTILQ